MNEWMDILVEIAARVMEGICLYLLFCDFGKRKRKKNFLWGSATVLSWVIIGKFISYAVYYDAPVNLARRVMSLLLRAALMWLLGVLVYRMERLVGVYVVMLFVASDYVCSQIGYGICLLLVSLLEQSCIRIEAMNNMTLVLALIKIIYLARYAVTIFLPYWAVRFLIKNHRHSINGRSAKELGSCILPAVMGNFAAVIFYFIQTSHLNKCL